MCLSVIKEKFGRWKASTRPLSIFVNTSNFKVPQKSGLTKRLQRNVSFFRSNYVVVFLVLVLYCLITWPLMQGFLIFFWVILTSLILITIHAVFYNSDAMDLAPRENTEDVASCTVEEV